VDVVNDAKLAVYNQPRFLRECSSLCTLEHNAEIVDDFTANLSRHAM
jgi:hypothetical protein